MSCPRARCCPTRPLRPRRPSWSPGPTTRSRGTPASSRAARPISASTGRPAPNPSRGPPSPSSGASATRTPTSRHGSSAPGRSLRVRPARMRDPRPRRRTGTSRDSDEPAGRRLGSGMPLVELDDDLFATPPPSSHRAPAEPLAPDVLEAGPAMPAPRRIEEAPKRRGLFGGGGGRKKRERAPRHLGLARRGPRLRRTQGGQGHRVVGQPRRARTTTTRAGRAAPPRSRGSTTPTSPPARPRASAAMVTTNVDRELVEKEVWFVGTGAEEVGTVGMKAFLREYGPELKDALIVNLDNLGTGNLYYITREGMAKRYYADRRLVGAARRAARENDLPVKGREYRGLSTDATPALARGFRAMSVMAFDINGRLPNWHWSSDTADQVSEGALETGRRLRHGADQGAVGASLVRRRVYLRFRFRRSGAHVGVSGDPVVLLAARLPDDESRPTHQGAAEAPDHLVARAVRPKRHRGPRGQRRAGRPRHPSALGHRRGARGLLRVGRDHLRDRRACRGARAPDADPGRRARVRARLQLLLPAQLQALRQPRDLQRRATPPRHSRGHAAALLLGRRLLVVRRHVLPVRPGGRPHPRVATTGLVHRARGRGRLRGGRRIRLPGSGTAHADAVRVQRPAARGCLCRGPDAVDPHGRLRYCDRWDTVRERDAGPRRAPSRVVGPRSAHRVVRPRLPAPRACRGAGEGEAVRPRSVGGPRGHRRVRALQRSVRRRGGQPHDRSRRRHLARGLGVRRRRAVSRDRFSLRWRGVRAARARGREDRCRESRPRWPSACGLESERSATTTAA